MKASVSLFQAPVKVRNSPALKPVTFKDFSGGWDATDDDDVLNVKYANVLQNMIIGTDGSLNSRPGTFRFTELPVALTGNIVDMTYFAGFLVVVTTTGQIGKVDGSGNVTVIWSAAIAAVLPGAPGGWNATVQVTFVPFRKDLIIHNGVNKPISIDQALHVTYLQDLVTGSSVNTPIGQYGCAVANFHVIAGIPSQPTVVYVSSTGTAGTFPLDDPPNDSISFDVGAYTSISTSEIRGIAGYRNWLMIFFRESTLIITLGQFKDVAGVQIHTPEFSDTLAKVGLLGQRTIVYVENDVIFASPVGVYSARRNLFAGLIESKPLSEVIAPGYNKLSRALTLTQEKVNAYSVYAPFVKTIFTNLAGPGIGYTFSEGLKIRGWSSVAGWAGFFSSCTSAQGRVFFGGLRNIWQMGNDVYPNEDVYADRMWAKDKEFTGSALSGPAGETVFDSTLFRMWKSLSNYSIPAGPDMLEYVQTHPTMWEEDFGVPIDIDWEMPWVDFREPERLKHVRTIKMGTKGTAQFNVSLYVDGLYKDDKGVVIHDPALMMNMVGNSIQGFGSGYTQTYGGGRKSNDPRLYKFPVKFKRCKVRVTGGVRNRLRILWVSFLLARGSFHRA